jgi:hypothetical protein
VDEVVQVEEVEEVEEAEGVAAPTSLVEGFAKAAGGVEEDEEVEEVEGEEVPELAASVEGSGICDAAALWGSPRSSGQAG